MGSNWTINTIKTGTLWESNNSGRFEVIAYRSAIDVDIRFVDTGFVLNTRSNQIRSGSVKDLMKPSVCGVGFIGGVTFKSKINGKHTKAYSSWRHIIKRCYGFCSDNAKIAYEGCNVSDEWLNFQNFADWYYTYETEDSKKYDVDKDIAFPGNKTYSKETCLLVESSINRFVLDSRKTRGEHMIGCSLSKGNGKFSSYCNNPFTGKCEHIGYFEREIDAHMAWRSVKVAHAIALAELQNDKRVRDAILLWAQSLKEFRVHPIEI
ncbi:hypothetical protein NVP1178O_06 [Vibrio phage 1.178.O._10N.286.45.E12]|nr:hypothetical protein NVP1178O_06 [Vibrio phage 1.178.O._10N.286.45.E12]